MEKARINEKKNNNQKKDYWNEFIWSLNGEPDDFTGILRAFFLAYWFASEVNNGGLWQYFENCNKFNHEEIAPALKELGLNEHAALFREAFKVYDALEDDCEEKMEEIQSRLSILPNLINLLHEILIEREKELIELVVGNIVKPTKSSSKDARDRSKSKKIGLERPKKAQSKFLEGNKANYEGKLIVTIERDVLVEFEKMIGRPPYFKASSAGNIQELDLRPFKSESFKLSALPPTISNLRSLKSLYMEIKRFRNFPDIILDLVWLKHLILNLNRNPIKEVPIEITRLKSLNGLTMNFGHLTSLESIGQLKSLKSLTLNKDRIRIVPESFGNFRSLKSLNLEKNCLTTLPESIGNLRSLEELDLKNNRISSLPESICKLEKLRKLDLRHNKLETLPNEIGNLKSLKFCYIMNNRLTSIPESFSNFIKQTSKIIRIENNETIYSSLDLTGNRISSLPKNLCLSSLTLDNNKLSSLPEEIRFYSSIESLDLSNNLLTSLPNWLEDLPLHSLYLKNNRFSSTLEIVDKLKSRGCYITI